LSRLQTSFSTIDIHHGLGAALSQRSGIGISATRPDRIPCPNEIVTLEFAVVVFSNFVQGFAASPMLCSMGGFQKEMCRNRHPLIVEVSHE
jgi:hypothetical protein